MIIDNLIPKNFYRLTNMSDVIPIKILKDVSSRMLQTYHLDIYKHEDYDIYILVRVSYYSVSIQDFDSKDDIIHYFEHIFEECIL